MLSHKATILYIKYKLLSSSKNILKESNKICSSTSTYVLRSITIVICIDRQSVLNLGISLYDEN